MTAAHPARVGRTRLDAGYLPERGGKRRRRWIGLAENCSGWEMQSLFTCHYV